LIVTLTAYAGALLIAQVSWTYFEEPLTKLGRSVPYESTSEIAERKALLLAAKLY
jgi:peptidoglycan/LPS O-acetylase OafA/YrhL